jgi:hypothetical protein
LTQQFNATPTHELAYLDWATNTLGEDIGQGNRQEAWFLGALGGSDPAGGLAHSDQLRQRVAFALSEILVISDQNTTLSGYPAGMAYMYDILTDNAFGNYGTLLQKVTLSPAMGVYLNMMGNRRADLTNNVHPDENYGREINQLFSIGLVMLNLADPDLLSDLDHEFRPRVHQLELEELRLRQRHTVRLRSVHLLLYPVRNAERLPHADDRVRYDRAALSR